MLRDSWPVGDHGVRPAGPPDRCFYCNQPFGQQHASGCVIRSRTVVAKLTIELLMDIPEDWTAQDFHNCYVDGTWCADNVVDELSALHDRIDEAGSCMCDLVDIEYVREADPKDEQLSQLFVEKLPS